MAANVLGAVVLVLAVAVTLPQFTRTVIRGGTAGLSFVSLGNTTVSSTAWCVYAVLEGDFWLLVTSLVYALGFGAVTVAYVARTRQPAGWRWVAGWLLFVSVAIAGSVTDVFPLGLSVAVVVGAVAWGAPQVVKVWRSDSVTGVSVTSWVMVLVDASLWGVYATLSDLPALAAWAILAVTSAVAVLSRVAVLKKHGVAAASV
jgi:uncharacterized protein with PQ loop repeat